MLCNLDAGLRNFSLARSYFLVRSDLLLNASTAVSLGLKTYMFKFLGIDFQKCLPAAMTSTPKFP